MTFILFHNPNCSKSRGCLKILKEKGIKFETRNYLKDKLDSTEIKKIIENLDGNLEDLIRNKKSLNFDIYQEKKKLIEFFRIEPKNLQRPIFYNNKKFIICRPPEKVLMVEGVGFEPT
tara:strand:- start:980 stop:1333 length:354 start_codon:yes stop_codon:yes gene_type:complete